MEKSKEFSKRFTRAKANLTFTAVTMVCLYSKVISDHKARRTGGQQVGENRTDGGTMLMKRAGGGGMLKKKKKKKRRHREGGRARQRRRDSREAKGVEELFISMTS